MTLRDSLKSATAAILISVAIAGCGHSSSGGDEAADKPAPNPVLLVSAAKAEVRPMKSQLRLLGRTMATRHIIIRAPTAGRVIGMKLASGDMVRKGQVVAHVLNREIEAAEAGLAVARKIDPDGARALGQSVARYDNHRGIPVVAPETGVVSQQPVTSGQLVADMDQLVDLVDPTSLYVEAAVPVSQLPLIKPGMPAKVTTPLRPGIEIPARVDAMLPSFDATSASSSVRLDFAGDERIPEAGAPVDVSIETATVPDAVVISSVALFQDPGVDRFHVFVIRPDGRAHRVDVTIGLRDRDQVQIIRGVSAGEPVVTSGGYALSDGLSVRVATANQ